jgi:hypothetical protein
VLLAVPVLAAGCSSSAPATPPFSSPPTVTVAPPVSSRPPVTVAPSTPIPPPAGLARCPVTQPNRIRPPGASPGSAFDEGSSYGNGRLWVGLKPDGSAQGVRSADSGGLIGVKFGWWRAQNGQLSITGRRLDGAAPALVGHVLDGYGDRGFQSSMVNFPAEGCWEVTGVSGTARLTFVTYVTE